MKTSSPSLETRTHLSKEVISQIDRIRNECGHEGTFRMAISNYLDKGQSFFEEITDEEIKNSFEKLKKKEEEDEAKKIISIMTPEFIIELTETGRKLAKIPMWDLLKYIQNYVYISN